MEEGNLCIRVDGTYIITLDETILGKYGKVNKETVGQFIYIKILIRRC